MWGSISWGSAWEAPSACGSASALFTYGSAIALGVVASITFGAAG